MSCNAMTFGAFSQYWGRYCNMVSFCRRRYLNVNTIFHIKKFQQLIHTFDGADANPENELNVGKFGSFTVFRINRPQKRNCLNYSSAVKLKEALAAFNYDKYSSVGIICGEGGNFCSGLDCDELASDPKFYNKFLELDLMSEFSRKPLIACVDGYAVGTGFDLALWCDLRVVEDTSILGYFNRRLGVPVPEKSIRRLIELVGKARAVDWVLTGKHIRPNEASEAGVVSRLVACGTGYGQTINLAKTIEKFPFTCTMLERIHLNLDSYAVEEQEKMIIERENLMQSAEKKIADGAKKFVEGFGRHGKSTNLK